jgi:hypothetical protein
LRVAAGLVIPTETETAYIKSATPGSTGPVEIADAIAIVRIATGLEATP